MKRFLHPLLIVGIMAAVLVSGMLIAEAQDKGTRGQGRRGDRPGGAMRDRGEPAQMAQRLRTALNCTDEEWAAIEPKLTNVTQAQSTSRRGGMMGRRGGPQGRPGGPPAAESTEAKELRKVLESDDTPDNEIKAKLKALRDARKKSDDALKKAREELREVLTTRQEARLVLSGILD
ncbi:MAG: hypothetical protein ACYS0H_12285 [Planctomycetota bacterium]